MPEACRDHSPGGDLRTSGTFHRAPGTHCRKRHELAGPAPDHAAVSQLSLSCDTMVSTVAFSKGGGTLFAKNSDRPANEAQPL